MGPQAGSGEHVMEQRTGNREPRLLGRKHELAVLWRQLEATTAGRLHVALVAGEPGSWKTRLLLENAEGAGAVGALFFSGGGSPAAGEPPYLPLLEAPRGAIPPAPLLRRRTQTHF